MANSSTVRIISRLTILAGNVSIWLPCQKSIFSGKWQRHFRPCRSSANCSPSFPKYSRSQSASTVINVLIVPSTSSLPRLFIPQVICASTKLQLAQASPASLAIYIFSLTNLSRSISNCWQKPTRLLFEQTFMRFQPTATTRSPCTTRFFMRKRELGKVCVCRLSISTWIISGQLTQMVSLSSTIFSQFVLFKSTPFTLLCQGWDLSRASQTTPLSLFRTQSRFPQATISEMSMEDSKTRLPKVPLQLSSAVSTSQMASPSVPIATARSPNSGIHSAASKLSVRTQPDKTRAWRLFLSTLKAALPLRNSRLPLAVTKHPSVRGLSVVTPGMLISMTVLMSSCSRCMIVKTLMRPRPKHTQMSSLKTVISRIVCWRIRSSKSVTTSLAIFHSRKKQKLSSLIRMPGSCTEQTCMLGISLSLETASGMSMLVMCSSATGSCTGRVSPTRSRRLMGSPSTLVLQGSSAPPSAASSTNAYRSMFKK